MEIFYRFLRVSSVIIFLLVYVLNINCFCCFISCNGLSLMFPVELSCTNTSELSLLQTLVSSANISSIYLVLKAHLFSASKELLLIVIVLMPKVLSKCLILLCAVDPL